MPSSSNNSKKKKKKKKGAKKQLKQPPGAPLSILKHGDAAAATPGRASYQPSNALMEHRPIPTVLVPDQNESYKQSVIQTARQKNATPTHRRFAQAFLLIQAAERLVVEHVLDDFCADDDGSNANVPIAQLYNHEAYFKACVYLIRAFTETDHRVGVSGYIWVRQAPSPSCWSCVTELHPLVSAADDNNDNDTSSSTRHHSIQLRNMSAKAFVVLLAEAIKLSFTSPLLALQLYHELHAHAAGGYDWLDWNDLATTALDDNTNNNDSNDSLAASSAAWLADPNNVRFALACGGIKSARRLYRNKELRVLRSNLPGADFGDNNKQHSSSFFLDSVEVLALEQCQFRPHSGRGYWNLAWVAQESAAKRRVHGLEAAAECLALMQRCFELADNNDDNDDDEAAAAEHDDFLRANARIEAACCLVLGAAGVVGYKLPNGRSAQVQRDLRSENSRWGKSFYQRNEGMKPFHFKVFMETEEDQLAITQMETDRIKRGIPATQLSPGETLLVPRWDVLQLWNEAMSGPYDSLTRDLKMNGSVYGEVCGWDAVVDFLQRTRHLSPGQYASAPVEPGFLPERDKGFEYTESITCAACGKKDKANQKCSRCKAVVYCSRECQVADWRKGHKRLCVPSKDS